VKGGVGHKRALADEKKRTALREAVDRYDHELLADEERMLLLDRIKRLRRQLALARSGTSRP